MPLPNPEQRAAFMRRPPPAERLLRVRQHVGALRDQYRILRVAVALNTPELSERERWLMEHAFLAGYVDGIDPNRKKMSVEQRTTAWLNSSAADATTLEMVLEKNAPPRSENTLIEQTVDAIGSILKKLEESV